MMWGRFSSTLEATQKFTNAALEKATELTNDVLAEIDEASGETDDMYEDYTHDVLVAEPQVQDKKLPTDAVEHPEGSSPNDVIHRMTELLKAKEEEICALNIRLDQKSMPSSQVASSSWDGLDTSISLVAEVDAPEIAPSSVLQDVGVEELSMLKSLLEEKEGAIQLLQEKLDDASKFQKQQLRNQLEALEVTHSEGMAALLKELSEVQHALAEEEERSFATNARLEIAQKSLMDATIRMDGLAEEKKAVQKKARSAANQHAETLQALQARISAMESSHVGKSVENALQAKLRKSAAQEKQLNTEVESLEDKIRRLQMQSTATKGELEQELKAAREQLKQALVDNSASSSMLETLKGEHQAEVSKLKSGQKQALADQKKMLTNIRLQEVARVSATVEATLSEQAQGQESHLRQKLHSLTTEITELKLNHEQTLQEQQEKHNQEHVAALENFAAKTAAEHKKVLVAQQQAHAQTVEEHQQNCKDQRLEFDVELAQLKAIHEQQEQHLIDLGDKHDRDLKILAETQAFSLQEATTRDAENKQAMDAQIQQHRQIVAALENTLQQQAEVVKAGDNKAITSLQESKNVVESQLAELTVELAAIKVRHSVALESLNTQLTESSAQQQREHARAIEVLLADQQKATEASLEATYLELEAKYGQDLKQATSVFEAQLAQQDTEKGAQQQADMAYLSKRYQGLLDQMKTLQAACREGAEREKLLIQKNEQMLNIMEENTILRAERDRLLSLSTKLEESNQRVASLEEELFLVRSDSQAARENELEKQYIFESETAQLIEELKETKDNVQRLQTHLLSTAEGQELRERENDTQKTHLEAVMQSKTQFEEDNILLIAKIQKLTEELCEANDSKEAGFQAVANLEGVLTDLQLQSDKLTSALQVENDAKILLMEQLREVTMELSTEQERSKKNTNAVSVSKAKYKLLEEKYSKVKVRNQLENSVELNQEGDKMVNRDVITKLLLTLFEHREREHDVMHLIMKILQFDEAETMKMNAARGKRGLGGKIKAFASYFSPYDQSAQQQPALTKDLSNENLADLWMDFLLQEAKSGDGATSSVVLTPNVTSETSIINRDALTPNTSPRSVKPVTPTIVA